MHPRRSGALVGITRHPEIELAANGDLASATESCNRANANNGFWLARFPFILAVDICNTPDPIFAGF
jgi:hypothetical protein